jgi:hypothetical protein
MKALVLVLVFVVAPQGTPPAPKNLKVLTPDVNIGKIMQDVNAALGVQCTYCHALMNFASDEVPQKEIARNMFRMLKQISLNFPDSGVDAMNKQLPFPEGKQYVTCYTCHQGSTKPKSAPTNSPTGAQD